ncbi:MAG: TetR/AcrR family transcriptional regulator [Acidimicrobiia bacterium]
MEDAGTETRRTARGRATRARIVDAAADLMFLGGVACTSLDEVLAASGTSKSQLYHYFSDKDDLVLAVIRRQTERVFAMQKPYLAELDSLAGLRRLCDASIELQRQLNCVGGCPIGSLAAELAESPQTRALLAESFEQYESYLVAGFTAMRDRAELKPGADPADLATAVIAAVQGGLLLTQTTRTTRPLELALDMALDHVAAQLR